MERPHLRARVPSAGAHRLLWWLLGAKRPEERARRWSAADAALGPNNVERLLSGDLEPSWDMGATIRNVTGGYVTAEDFQRRRLRRWWFDKPFDFHRVPQ